MRVEIGPGRVKMYLSQRNLDTLVKCTKLGTLPFLNRLQEDDTVIAIEVEPNDVHYRERSEAFEHPSRSVRAILDTPDPQ
jgi:hypothetical protein